MYFYFEYRDKKKAKNLAREKEFEEGQNINLK